MSRHYHRLSPALSREQRGRREFQCLMNVVLSPLPSTPGSTLRQVKQQKGGRVRGKRALTPVTVQHSASRGSQRMTAKLRVNLLAGRLQGTRHFHSAPIEIGQNKRA